MITPTFDQMVMVFVTGVVIIFIFAWIAALIIDKKHREDPKIPRSRIYPFNKENEPFIVDQEMYNIWVGRIFDIVSAVRGMAERRIDGEHYLTVFIWMLTLGIITGYFRAWYPWGFMSFMIVLIVLGTYVYAHWRHDEPFKAPPTIF